MLFPILSGIQHLHLFTTYVPFIQKQYAEIISFIDFIAVGVISAYYTFKFMFLDRQRRHLSNLFRGWQFYTTIVLVPSIICAFGIQASLAGKVLRSRLPNNITPPFAQPLFYWSCWLTTAGDSFSSKSNKELVRNLSVLMVANLFDAIEMLDNAFSLKAW